MFILRWPRIFQGNQSNRYVLLNSKVVDYINFILRAGEFKNCPMEKVSRQTTHRPVHWSVLELKTMNEWGF